MKEEKPASKTTRKASAKKAPAAKKTDAPKVSLTLQYLGKELTQEAMVEAVKAQWTGADIKTLALYVKPEDNAVYYGQWREHRQDRAVSDPNHEKNPPERRFIRISGGFFVFCLGQPPEE